jgi:acyl-CoA reductase-like NAD-dependent aldehyde dehydrogenase
MPEAPTHTIEARNLVGGDWEGSPTVVRANPARPEDVVTLSAVADEEAVRRAVAAAGAAQRDWAASSSQVRGAVLERASAILASRLEDIAVDLTREEGKTLTESRGEVARAAAIFRFFGGEGWRMSGQTFPGAVADALIYTRREALGVVAAITPWNFPIAIPAWKLAPALVAGNSVILKPAQLASGTAWHLVDALVAAGIPPGVVSLVHGPGSALGEWLLRDDDVRAVSFTGSIPVGRGIHELAAKRRIRVQVEMGGKNALVVLDDADPQVAATIAATGGFGLTGQACTATSRVICTPGIRAAFIDAFVEESQRFAPGDGLDPGVLMGPVVSDEQADTDEAYVGLARTSGATIAAGGPRRGQLQPPVIVTHLAPDDRLAQEEVFGPIVAVLDAQDLSQAIELVNATRYGLTAGIVTNDLAAAQRFIREARVGVVKVNQPTTGLELNVPFGGMKDSSTNTFREQGSAAVDFYTQVKSVYLSPPGWR